MSQIRVYAAPPSPVGPAAEDEIHKLSGANFSFPRLSPNTGNLNHTPRSIPLSTDPTAYHSGHGEHLSPPTGDSVDAEVDAALKNYFSTLKEKDDDIFRLYEDNKRMKRLVEEAIQHREELSSQFDTQSLLVSALQTELREKGFLLEAQDKENQTLRNCVSQIRVALHRTSELQYGPEVLVEDVESLVEAQEEWVKGMKLSRLYLRHFSALLFDCLVQEEQWARAMLQETESMVWREYVGLGEADNTTSPSSYRPTLVQWIQCIQSWEQYLDERVQHVTELYCKELQSATHQHEMESERQNMALQRVQRESATLSQQIQYTNTTLDQRDNEVVLLKQLLRLTDSQTQLLLHRCEERVRLMDEWYLDEKRVLQEWVASCLRKAVELEGERDQLREEELQSTAERRQLQEEVKRLNKAVKALKPFEEQYQTLLVKHHTTEEQLVGLQKKHQHLVEQSTKEEKKRSTLQKQLTVRTEECELNAAKWKQFNERWESKGREINQLKRKMTLLQDSGERLRQQLESERTTWQIQIKEERETARQEQQSLTQQYEAQRRTLEQELRDGRAQHSGEKEALEAQIKEKVHQLETVETLREKEKAEMGEEIQKWVEECETLRRSVEELTALVEREKKVREILESQQKSEMAVVKKILSERNLNEIPQEKRLLTKPSAPQQGSPVAFLEAKVKQLELVCQRSHQDILCLRDALHLERLCHPSNVPLNSRFTDPISPSCASFPPFPYSPHRELEKEVHYPALDSTSYQSGASDTLKQSLHHLQSTLVGLNTTPSKGDL